MNKRPMATRRRYQAETPLETALATISLILFFAGVFALLIILDSAEATSETRCFTTAVGSEYCRTQSDWGDS